jgi:hypothetical protein
MGLSLPAREMIGVCDGRARVPTPVMMRLPWNRPGDNF